MQIPVYVSCPSSLSKAQSNARAIIIDQLERFNLEQRALGRSDYPTELPLREVMLLARRCSGGVILGFEQHRSLTGIHKPDTTEEKRQDSPISFPTPWNQIEAGILFGLRLPMIMFREKDIESGVFAPGITDVFIHPMPSPKDGNDQKTALGEVFLRWQAEVRGHYYRD
jgi:hypothetical protein